MPPAPVLTRPKLVAAAEHRVLYESLWDRGAAHHCQQVISVNAFSGRAAVLWALVTWHDNHHAPWPGEEPYAGVRRVLAIWNTARSLPDHVTGRDPMLDRAPQVAVTTHALALAALAPSRGWVLDLDTALDVLNHSAGFHAAVFHAAALDTIVNTLAHHAQGDAA